MAIHLQKQTQLSQIDSNFVDNTRFINSQLAIVYVIDIITMELMEKSEYSSTMNKTVELIMDRKLSK